MNLMSKFLLPKKAEFRIHHDEEHIHFKLMHEIKNFLPKNPYQPIAIVCIGTDRSTGDSLGPIVGTKLQEKVHRPYIVHGTLEDPVHAVNLNEKVNQLSKQKQKPFVIAIDACLGKHHHVGMISLGNGPITPGAAVKKDLPPIGNIHLTGIVNISGFMEYFVLQNTRLNLVMKLANIIADSLYLAISTHIREFGQNNPNPKTNNLNLL